MHLCKRYSCLLLGVMALACLGFPPVRANTTPQVVMAPPQPDASDTVEVTVFYEALCSDSINFIIQQLLPTATTSLQDYISVDLVPFGFAKFTPDPWNITCQHGPLECFQNAIHACGLTRINKDNRKVQYVGCLMKTKNTSQCFQEQNLQYREIEQCADGDEGHRLIMKNGNRTGSFRPTITFVPTVVFNNVYNKQDQDQALTDLKGVICNKLATPPPACE